MKLSALVVALACLLVRSKPSLRMATSARSTNPLVSIAALASPLAPPVLSRHKGYLPSKSKTCPFFGGCFCCISWFVWTSHDFFIPIFPNPPMGCDLFVLSLRPVFDNTLPYALRKTRSLTARTVKRDL